MHSEKREGEEEHQEQRPHHERNREIDLAEQPTAHGSDQHRRAANHLAGGEDTIHGTVITQTPNSVDEPRLHRPRVEGVSESQEHRHGSEGDDSRPDLGEGDIAQR